MTTGFIFSGQGAQHVGMGQTLHENSVLARDLYDKANEILGWDLKTVCFEGPDELLTETKVCQPALYVQGVALCKLLLESGKLANPIAVCGLSLGELTALAVAGVYDFETGLRMVAERGRLMQLACESTQGAMAAVIGGTLDEVKLFCNEFDIEIANLNCPGQIVVSGEKEKVSNAVEGAKGRFKLCKPLNVAGAYHSRLMNSAKEAFAEFIKDMEFKTPELAVYTNVSGKRVDNPKIIKESLVDQIVSPVRFEDCLRNMAAEHNLSAIYECGPGKILTGFGKRIDRELNILPVSEFSDLYDLIN